MEPTFFIWVLIACTQITLFALYLIKMNKWGKEEIISESIDIFPVVNYNGKTYWLEDSSLYRESIEIVTMNKEKAERVDQLNSSDLNPSEIIYIIDLLKDGK